MPKLFPKDEGAIKPENYTRNESRRCKTRLETSGEDVNYTRNEWRRYIVYSNLQS
jgi:hypothetical protein